MNTAVQGMNAQTTRLSATADNVANADTPGYRRQVTHLTTLNAGSANSVQATVRTTTDGDGDVDLGREITEISEAATSFALNADVFETGADLWQMLSTVKRD
jgi:flagellar basal-body rod protein FlgC